MEHTGLLRAACQDAYSSEGLWRRSLLEEVRRVHEAEYDKAPNPEGVRPSEWLDK